MADALQTRFHDDANVVIGGRFSVPFAWRAELDGVVRFPIPVFWNTSRR